MEWRGIVKVRIEADAIMAVLTHNSRFSIHKNRYRLSGQKKANLAYIEKKNSLIQKKVVILHVQTMPVKHGVDMLNLSNLN